MSFHDQCFLDDEGIQEHVTERPDMNSFWTDKADEITKMSDVTAISIFSNNTDKNHCSS